MVTRTSSREIRQRNASSASRAASAAVSIPWDGNDDALLRKAVARFGPKRWREISEMMTARPKSRSAAACRERWMLLTNHGNSPEKRKWTSREDAELVVLVERHENKNWALIASELPGRSAKQCRERWQNQVRPDLNHGPWTPQEDAEIVLWQHKVGNKWATIAERLAGRTDNMVKNRWYSTLARGRAPLPSELVVSPVTVKPRAVQAREPREKSKKRRRASTSGAKKKKLKSVSQPKEDQALAFYAPPKERSESPPIHGQAIESPDAVDDTIEPTMRFPSLEESMDEGCETCDEEGEAVIKMEEFAGDWCASPFRTKASRFDEWVPEEVVFAHDDDQHLEDLESWGLADRFSLHSAVDHQTKTLEDEDEEGDPFGSPFRPTVADAFECEV